MIEHQETTKKLLEKINYKTSSYEEYSNEEYKLYFNNIKLIKK